MEDRQNEDQEIVLQSFKMKQAKTLELIMLYLSLR